MAQSAQLRRDGSHNQLVVIYQENGEPAGLRNGHELTGFVQPLPTLDGRRQRDAYLRAVAQLTLDFHVSVVGLDRTVDRRQPESCALAARFGTEEGLHRVFEHVFRHTRARVFNVDLNSVIAAHAGAQGEKPTPGHGVQGVDEEVHDGATQGGHVTCDWAKPEVEFPQHLDTGRDRPTEQIELFLQERAQINRL